MSRPVVVSCVSPVAAPVDGRVVELLSSAGTHRFRFDRAVACGPAGGAELYSAIGAQHLTHLTGGHASALVVVGGRAAEAAADLARSCVTHLFDRVAAAPDGVECRVSLGSASSLGDGADRAAFDDAEVGTAAEAVTSALRTFSTRTDTGSLAGVGALRLVLRTHDSSTSLSRASALVILAIGGDDAPTPPLSELGPATAEIARARAVEARAATRRALVRMLRACACGDVDSAREISLLCSCA